MKKVALLCLGLALGAANAAEAQLTMQMSNGWSFTFAGNVNAFVDLRKAERRRHHGHARRTRAGGGRVKGLSIRTGLLPAFAVFDAKGKEGKRISACTSASRRRSSAATGVARLLRRPDRHASGLPDRRRHLGSDLAGRELGLFSRQNILTDQTLFGIGATGGIGGRRHDPGPHRLRLHLPAVQAQMTYSTAGRPAASALDRLFEPALGDGAVRPDRDSAGRGRSRVQRAAT